jgi:acetyltransferase
MAEPRRYSTRRTRLTGKVGTTDKAENPGHRLAILTNGGGVGVLAVDRLIDLGGTLAEISPDTRARLDAALPPTWSKANPVDIVGDADAARYSTALEALLADPANDAVLVLNVPTSLASPTVTADAVAWVTREYRTRTIQPKPVLAVWIGADDSNGGALDAAGIPAYETEADAVRGFTELVRYAQVRGTRWARNDAGERRGGSAMVDTIR